MPVRFIANPPNSQVFVIIKTTKQHVETSPPNPCKGKLPDRLVRDSNKLGPSATCGQAQVALRYPDGVLADSWASGVDCNVVY